MASAILVKSRQTCDSGSCAPPPASNRLRMTATSGSAEKTSTVEKALGSWGYASRNVLAVPRSRGTASTAKSTAAVVPPPFQRSPLLGLLDVGTLRDRAPLLASASLTSLALAIPAWKEGTVRAATSAVKVLEVRLIGPNATILAVVCFRAAPPSATVPALSVPLYE